MTDDVRKILAARYLEGSAVGRSLILLCDLVDELYRRVRALEDKSTEVET